MIYNIEAERTDSPRQQILYKPIYNRYMYVYIGIYIYCMYVCVFLSMLEITIIAGQRKCLVNVQSNNLIKIYVIPNKR